MTDRMTKAVGVLIALILLLFSSAGSMMNGNIFSNATITASAASDPVMYTYKTVYLDCSNGTNWRKSWRSNTIGSFGGGVVVSYQFLSYKKVPDTIYLGNNKRIKRNVTVNLPYKVRFKYHKHTYKTGFGYSWYYTNNGIQLVDVCDCGYRKATFFWEIPG